MKNSLALWCVLVSAAVLGSWLAVMSLDNDPPYEYTSGTIDPNPAREGGRVILEWQIKIRRQGQLCPGSVQRTLFNNHTGEAVAIYDPTPSALTVKLGDTKLRKSFLLPDDLSGADEVRYEASICFRCNALQYVLTNRLCTKTPPVIFKIQR